MCYDGASTMRGAKNGVAKQLSDEENRAVHIHCYGHALNVAAADSIKNLKIMKDALDVTYEVTKLIKFSPKRDVMFEKLKENIKPDTPGFQVLCQTHWTVRASSLKWIIDNYIVLQEIWEQAKDEVSDPSLKSRIIDVQAQFKTEAIVYKPVFIPFSNKGQQYTCVAMHSHGCQIMVTETSKTTNFSWYIIKHALILVSNSIQW